MTTDTQNIPGSAEEPEKRLYTTQFVVIPRHGTIMPLPDLLKMHETGCLKKIVEKVHDDGFVGETWPKVETVPLTRQFGGWREMTQEEVDAGEIKVDEYHVRVSVRAVPR